MVDGTPGRVGLSFDGTSLIAATVERQIYHLTAAGHLGWAATAPDDPHTVALDATGQRALVALAGGRLLQLAWDIPPGTL